MAEENEFGSLCCQPGTSASGEQAELITTVDTWKKNALILEIKQARQGLCVDYVLEEELGGIVGRDAGRKYPTGSPPLVNQRAHSFSEYGVVVDSSATTEGIAATITKEMADAIVIAQRCRVRGKQL